MGELDVRMKTDTSHIESLRTGPEGLHHAISALVGRLLWRVDMGL